jgi:hypothetical protein
VLSASASSFKGYRLPWMLAIAQAFPLSDAHVATQSQWTGSKLRGRLKIGCAKYSHRKWTCFPPQP